MKFMIVLSGILLTLVFTLTPLQALEETSVKPGINDHYRNADAERWRQTFEQDGREVYARRFDILQQLALQPGNAVADIGAGSGFFSFMFAKQTGQTGKVYAVDITTEFVDAITQRATAEGVGNIVGIVSNDKDTRLPENSVDLVFISDTYHHFEYPFAMLASIHRALKPGGRMVIIDFKRIPGESSAWVLQHVRAGQAEVTAEVESAGFKLHRSADFMLSQYYLEFIKSP